MARLSTGTATGVSVSSSGGAIQDGIDSNIKATVLDYVGSNPLAVRLTDTDGNYVVAGGGVQYDTNVAYQDGDTGTMALTIRTDSPTILTEANGDYSALRVNSFGCLWVEVGNTVTTAVSNEVTVNSTNLDIRDLTHVSDSVKIGDGTETATIRDVTGAKSLDVSIVDGTGNQITTFGGGVQYAEGDIVPIITGNALMFEGNSNTIKVVSFDTPLPVSIESSSVGFAINDGGSSQANILTAGQDALENTYNELIVGSMGYVFNGTRWDRTPGNLTDGLLVNLGTNNDVVVSATDLDIRNLTSASDSVSVIGGVASTSGSLSASGQIELTLNGQNSAAVQISGTWTGFGTIEGTVDGTNWEILSFSAASTAATSTGISNGLLKLNTAGLIKIRVNWTRSSGTLNATLRANFSNNPISIATTAMGTTTVGATDLDIRNLSSTQDNIEVKQATGTNLHTVVDSGSVTANAGTNLNTSALALDTTLTGGSQKSQIVDSGGEAVTVTGGKLDVNATVDTTGLALDATLVAIKDTDGIKKITDTVTVQATNLDIRDLTSASDSVEVKQATGTNLHTVVDSGAIKVSSDWVTDTNNSSTSTLLSDGVFTGTSTDITGYTQISVSAISDKASATNGMTFQFSQDNTNWDHTSAITLPAGNEITTVLATRLRYFRVVYTNTNSAQTYFRLQTRLNNGTSFGTVRELSLAPTDSDLAQTTHSVITGRTTVGGGSYIDVKVNPSGALTADVTATDLDIRNLSSAQDSVTVTSITNALPAGTNNIGDVDVASIAAGTNNIGQVSVAPQTANGLAVFNGTSSDGGTALTATAQAIKASAGQVYGWYIYNPNTAAAFVQLYNTAAASVTVGTTAPLFMLTIPAGSAANVEFTNGITFSNAGFSCAATSTAGGNGALTTALDAVIFYK